MNNDFKTFFNEAKKFQVPTSRYISLGCKEVKKLGLGIEIFF